MRPAAASARSNQYGPVLELITALKVASISRMNSKPETTKVVTVAAITLLVLLFSGADLRPGEARARFFGLMLVFTGAMLLTAGVTWLLVAALRLRRS